MGAREISDNGVFSPLRKYAAKSDCELVPLVAILLGSLFVPVTIVGGESNGICMSGE